LQIIIEQLLGLKVKLILTQRLLISLDHHEYNLLILIGALKEVLEVPLLLYLILGLFNMIDIVRLFLHRLLLDIFLIVRFYFILIVHLRLLSFTFVQDLVIIVFFGCFSFHRLHWFFLGCLGGFLLRRGTLLLLNRLLLD